ncbi:pentapeptide repeat-containing protein [Algoriphagus alkaliphilus]|uniref:pentapeptide repeat-containing protein n=1 Tax=Algoriphagus alkaliphilus TaxID=279824 RepID=UPI000B80869C|nr:pentapeptide repeat-containing protein [Algoriphagus alkaliphilus]
MISCSYSHTRTFFGTGTNETYCNFFNLKLKKSIFQKSRLFGGGFFSGGFKWASFLGSELSGAVFDQTNLEKADFREAENYRIDPESNRIKIARFDLEGLPGLLGKYGIKIGKRPNQKMIRLFLI